jgi:tRNA pseudouridine13 synthase
VTGNTPGPEAPEDFCVDEIPLYPTSGEGDHTFLRVEKRMRSTDEVARDLARAAGVRPRDIGYAGRKDRRGVTTQWFSVPGLAPDRALALELPGARVLAADRHPHKLRTGHLRGNRFRVAVRGAGEDGFACARSGLDRLARLGMPNRYGGQRFGRDGANALRGAQLLRGEGRSSDRRHARFLVSALQSEVFNRVLAARETPLDRLELGDIAVVHASGGLFLVEDLAREDPRAAAFEISATGPIFGTRVQSPDGPVADRERAVLAACGVDLDGLRPPRGIRLRGARRPLRVQPVDTAVERADDAILVEFTLPPGSFATVLLEEIFGAGPRPVIG